MASDNIDALLERIDEIDLIENKAWLGELNQRKIAELEFHNRDRDPEFRAKAAESEDSFERFYGNKKYYDTIKRSKAYVDNWIAENARGKVFLDYACGNGHNALHAARSGAKLALGLDVSDVSVQNCRRFAAEQGLSNTRFFQADAENTKLPDNSVDAIMCSGMLHHLDLSYAFPELRRILKPGGKILCLESLEYNPAIKLYRMLTPDMRTDYEKAHILGFKDLRFARRFFDVRNVRYWHVVGYAGGKLTAVASLLDRLDRLFEKVPGVNWMAWIFTFELHKRAE
ncbi:putative methyltransferase [Sphingomonas changbaiensis NBRC 104936]|uniref:Putative methyltransferase n=1 Tax=Sphingomonas changbaiensis NBRC 104936 TaxID=1219043 RepID=A0A0E9MMP8_9SPHN|nr:class I SAM-dependent methyltransferase [Sphingomonas changbaiensis]GAO39047.1 putative methyltransferase [Sphingomonas changbaiensis NBRC 104936]